MLCYSTLVDVSDEFNKDILLKYYFEWLDTTRNKMEGLDYNYQTSFVYEVKNKKIRIEDFHEHHIFGIYFSTRDNEKNFEFNVEILYNYNYSSLLLNFYKKMHEDSKDVSALSIPRIFRALLSSEYILKDYNLRIKNEPYFFDNNRYEKVMQTPHDFPIVVLTKNKKCLVHPYNLAEGLFTIGHVLVVNTNQKPTVTIYYPDGNKESIEHYPEKYMISLISDRVRNYVLDNNLQYLTFDDYMRLRLENIHNEKKESLHEFESYFDTEITDLKHQVSKLRENFENEYKKFEILTKQKEELEAKLFSQNKTPLLISKDKDISKKQELLIDIMNETLRDLPNEETYRKRDILLSVKEEL